MTGRISKAIATESHLPVIHGVEAKGHALHWELIFQVSTTKRKMFMCKVFTAANSLGWACLIATLKEHLCGVMEHHMTSITGQMGNQTTWTTRTAFILLVSFETTSMNGTMSIARIAIDSPVKKVGIPVLIHFQSLKYLRYFQTFVTCIDWLHWSNVLAFSQTNPDILPRYL